MNDLTSSTELTTTIPDSSQKFDINLSMERIREYEKRGTGFKVRCGLALLNAKRNLNHGAWYGFLRDVGLYPSTASRRMQVANMFIDWFYKSHPEDVSQDQLTDVVNLTEISPCILHDFSASQRISIDRFCSEVIRNKTVSLPVQNDVIVVHFNPAWAKIEGFMNKKYRKLPNEKKTEFKDYLQMIETRAHTLLELTLDLDRQKADKNHHPKR